MRQRFKSFLVLWVAACLALGPAGCARVEKEEESPFSQRRAEYVLTVVIDLSGSYAQFMQEGGRAYRFLQGAIQRFYRDRMGSDDRLIIAQISATTRATLFDGHPRSLKSEYPTSQAFNTFLASKSHPAGSRVHASIADALQYMIDTYHSPGSTTRSGLLVLSDMEDNFPDSSESKAKLVALLEEYGKHGGSVGMYWVALPSMQVWQRHLRDSRLKEFVIESEIVVDPKLPRFEF